MSNTTSASATDAPHSPSPTDASVKPTASLHAKIDAWYLDHFNSVPIGWEHAMRAHVHKAVQDLKARLGV